LKWSGNNWENYNNDLTVQENIDILYKNEEEPDVVVAYKPLELKNFSDVNAVKCIRYNEMYDEAWTTKEILESGPDVVVCHHLNDMLEYKDKFPNLKFVNVPHGAEKTIFKDYGLEKKVDILLAGSIWHVSKLGNHYPLRRRIAGILKRMSKEYKCGVFPHPGGNLYNAHKDIYARQFAMAVNSTKICVTCSGLPKSRFGKYVEIPMCASAIAADLPDEQQDQFKNFVIDINTSMSDQEIMDKLIYYIENDSARQEKIDIGLKYAEKNTQEEYARRFINIFQ